MVGMAPWSSAYEPFTNRETLERRRGAKIKGRGIYRDAVRSSRSQLVKASGLRWISLMWLGHVPWAGRHWALPVLTVLAPSTRYYQQQGRRHKKLTDWARQMVMQLRRWLPQRPLVLVGDNSYAVLDLLHCCQSLREPVTLIARLRLDAALYAPAPARQPGQNGRPPLKGARRPALKTILDQPQATGASVAVAWYGGTTRTVELTSQTAVWYRSGKPPVLIRWVLIRDPQGAFATQALLCTDLTVDPTQILEWFARTTPPALATGSCKNSAPYQVRRAGSGQEVRTHLGVETQRQWSDLAIARTTARPAGDTLRNLLLDHPGRPRVAKTAPHDPAPSGLVRQAVADLRGRHCPMMRRHPVWLASEGFSTSAVDPDTQELPVALYHRLVDSLAYAA